MSEIANRSRPSRRPDRVRRHRTAGDWTIFAIAILVGFVIAAPLLIILINSFKSPTNYANSGPLTLPAHLYFDGIVNFWNRVNFPEKLWNSFLISSVVAIAAVFISLLNSFAIGIGRVRGRTWVLILFLVANMIPQEALLYPLYYMFKQVGLYDNVWSVIIIFTVTQSAFGTYLLSSVFGTFPKEVLEAASVDGASRWQILWRVIAPISRQRICQRLAPSTDAASSTSLGKVPKTEESRYVPNALWVTVKMMITDHTLS